MKCSDIYLGLCARWEVAVLAADRLQRIEAEARERCLAPLGEAVAALGMQRPIADYSRAEVLCLIDTIVTAYQAAMQVVGEETLQRERAQFAARGLAHPLDEVPF